MHQSRFQSCVRVALLCLLPSTASFGQSPGWQPGQVVATTGFTAGPLYGLPAFATLNNDSRPRINNAGDIAFAFVPGTPDQGVWANGAALPRFLTPTLVQNHPFGQVSLNDNGVIAWYGSTSSGDPGVYTYDLRAATGANHGGSPGDRYTKYSPIINNAGSVAMLDSPNGQFAIARLNTATDVGAVVPGTPGISPSSPYALDQNNAGQIAYIDRSSRRVMRVEGNDSITTEAFPLGRTLYGGVSINNLGDIAYFRKAAPITPDITELVVKHGSTTSAIATAGAGQGLSAFGAVAGDPMFSPVINDRGWVAFLGLSPSGLTSLYVFDGTNTTALLTDGDLVATAVGTLSVTFGQLRGVDMNDQGDLVVLTGLRYPNGAVGNSVIEIRAIPSPGVATSAAALALAGIRRRRPLSASAPRTPGRSAS